MEYDVFIFLGIIGGALYTLWIFLKRNQNKQNEKSSLEYQKASSRFIFGGALGFIIGIVIGVVINPLTVPWNTVGDVPGLTIASWLGFGFIGLIIGSFFGLFLSRGKKDTERQ